MGPHRKNDKSHNHGFIPISKKRFKSHQVCSQRMVVAIELIRVIRSLFAKRKWPFGEAA